jgi:phage tail protein X
MFELYTVTEEQRLDNLCKSLFGSDNYQGYVTAILDATRGLADEGLELQAGQVLRIPKDVVSDTIEIVRIWT